MNHRIVHRVRELRYSVIRDMTQRAAGYDDAILLSIGEPDFDTPEPICRKAMTDVLQGHTHYTHAQGIPELREALAARILEQTSLEVHPDRIVVTHGGVGGIVAALRTLVDEGEEVLVPEPHYPDYRAHIAFAGGILRPVITRFEEGFIPLAHHVEAAITPKTRVLLLNSPNNPTGAVIPGSVLDELADVVRKYDLLVISDEVYDEMVFRGDFQSIVTRPGMSERTVVVKSFSKTFAMTGWRIGYSYGPSWIMEHMRKVVNYSTLCANTMGQRAAMAALGTDRALFSAMRDEFSRRSALVCERLRQMPHVRVLPPSGTFYVFVDIREVTSDSLSFALELLDREHVVVVPGFAFGGSGEGCIRLACTVSGDRLNEAMDRLERFLNEYGRRGNGEG
ncbi:MAG: pyridoxal phosphate-dependent aminotransferase [Thermodesulfobacteriota bacterium]